ncbi:MAG: glycosyltransferase family 4 protein [Nitrososphaeria archaeon]
MKIAMYIDSVASDKGGMQRDLENISNYLSKRGETVYIISPFYKLNPSNEIKKAFMVSADAKLKAGKITIAPNIIKKLFIIKPNIILVNGPSINEIFILLYAKFTQTPCILIYHADFTLKIGKIINRLYALIFYRFYYKIFVQTFRDYKKLIKRGVNYNKLLIFHFGGVDLNKFKCYNKNDKKNGILFVGRLDSGHLYKGLDLLLFSLKRYQEKFGNNIHLTIIGSGNLRKNYERIAKEFGLEVSFVGDVTDQELTTYYCKSALLVLPSKDEGEGFGLVAVEAIACGTPVIVSKYAGIAELIMKYDAGLVVDPYNLESMALAINNLYKDPDLRKKVIENGYILLKKEKLDINEINYNLFKNLVPFNSVLI